MRIVTMDDDHLILISDRGKLIRMRVRDIGVKGRATQGMRLMRVDEGEIIAAIERLAEPAEESGIAEAAPIEAVDDGDTVPVDMDGEGEGEDLEDEGDDAADDDAADAPDDDAADDGEPET